ncbi:MAG: chorismate mutase [Anaerolineae bacterium]
MYTNGKNGHQPTERMHQPTACRGVRGATTVASNDAAEIVSATRELLDTIVRLNDMNPDDVASVYFTTTMDLDAAYPAQAARDIGWYDVALLCGHEMNIPGSLPRCIRVLIHWNTTRKPKDIVHVYMRDARSLRPDKKNRPPVRPIQMSLVEAAVKMLGSSL